MNQPIFYGRGLGPTVLRKNDEVGLQLDVKDVGICGQHVYLPCNETQFGVNDRKQTQESQK